VPPRGEPFYRSRSLWLDQLEETLEPATPLAGDVAVDVAIIGAGFTGLWTAYELARRDPTLRIAILERDIAGFGASGRNGGWCSALFAGKRDALARDFGRDSVVALLAEMRNTVEEVGRACEREGIDAAYHRGGTLTVASSPAHVDRLRAELDDEFEWGATEADLRWLTAPEVDARLHVTANHGGLFTPHCARVQPARLARGLARIVRGLGVTLAEDTAVVDFAPRRVTTNRGVVTAEIVVRATEGYTPQFAASRRALAPLYSLMVATEPLTVPQWDAIGWSGAETLTDGRQLLIYAQRTADGRIAFGGRGAPYHFGSKIDDDYDRNDHVFDELRRNVRTMFPGLADVGFSHAWGGPLGVPRDWCSSVGLERRTGLAWAGGYVGDGVSTTNLAGRTLADLITGVESPLVKLPWVQHRSPQWEPEPLRWLGITAGLQLPIWADRVEGRTGRPARRLGALINRLT
jgi:glycine/D-amino acid oxidase-like deaminating enzyme